MIDNISLLRNHSKTSCKQSDITAGTFLLSLQKKFETIKICNKKSIIIMKFRGKNDPL